MMKNRAGLLALAVLVIAILLMVFFVMPRIGGDAAKVGDAINQAGSEVKNTVTESAKTSRSSEPDDAATTQELGAATAAAGQALTELKALFADGKGPTEDVFGAAKSKATTSLQALADIAVPEGTNPVTAAACPEGEGWGSQGARCRTSATREYRGCCCCRSQGRCGTDWSAGTCEVPAAGNQTPGNGAQGTTGSPPETSANTGPKLPTFDALRVEPDGSTVIAGSAEPNSKIEIIDGDKVVTTTQAGAGGDFAVVLDNPLLGRRPTAVRKQPARTERVPHPRRSLPFRCRRTARLLSCLPWFPSRVPQAASSQPRPQEAAAAPATMHRRIRRRQRRRTRLRYKHSDVCSSCCYRRHGERSRDRRRQDFRRG